MGVCANMVEYGNISFLISAQMHFVIGVCQKCGNNTVTLYEICKKSLYKIIDPDKEILLA